MADAVAQVLYDVAAHVVAHQVHSAYDVPPRRMSLQEVLVGSTFRQGARSLPFGKSAHRIATLATFAVSADCIQVPPGPPVRSLWPVRCDAEADSERLRSGKADITAKCGIRPANADQMQQCVAELLERGRVRNAGLA